jgi:hypothetical protein
MFEFETETMYELSPGGEGGDLMVENGVKKQMGDYTRYFNRYTILIPVKVIRSKGSAHCFSMLF